VGRSQPKESVEGVRYEVGSAEEVAGRVIPGTDAVVAALSPRGDMAGRLVEVYAELARVCAEAGARYLQVGGFSSLRPAAGEPRFVEGELAEQHRAEAMEGARRAHRAHRVSGEVALFDAEGGSNISGADFADAVVDEIERPAHHREHIGVAY